MINQFSDKKYSNNVLKRFWNKVKKGENTNDCWIWIAGKNSDGYGQLYIKPTMVKAHKISYEIHIGKIPEGLELDHLCRNRSCVNPNHLEPVTRLENLARGIRNNGNKNKTHCKNGHEFNEQNTCYDKRGTRTCRKCRNLRSAIFRMEKN